MTLYQILSLIGIPSLVVSILLSVFNHFKYKAIEAVEEEKRKQEEKAKEHNLLMNGMVAILHNMVYTQGKMYIKQGEITTADLKDYEYLYEAYHAMGGNGTGTEIFERVKELKIKVI